MTDRRAFIGGALATLANATRAQAARGIDVVVSKDGAPGTVATIAEALALADHRTRPDFRILVEDGIHAEKLTIDRPDVTLIGRSPAAVITASISAGTRRADGTNWGTSGSATITVTAPGVTLRGLTIRNDYDYLAARAAGDGVITGNQAVALLIDRGADRTFVEDCRIESYQDTLYVQPRALLRRCRIAGGVDFIFGGGAALFEACEIVTRHVPGAPGQGYVAAPSTPAAQRFGLVFDHCRLTREPGVPDVSAYLGRPWRAGGNMALTGSATFLHCWMDAHIRPDGWTSMGYRDPAGVQHMLTPQEARLAEFATTGPGAAPAGNTRRHLTPAEAAAFTPAAILGGWTGNRA